ncbi:MAG: hypothetical protein IKU63_00500 [Bacteroidaceae bacterium]|nr:hypothetical protein [Bacteroidaceae bacterium]
MKTFVLKYGILFLLMTMLIAMALFMNSLELRSKQPAVLIQTGNDFRIYLDPSVPVYRQEQDYITIVQTIQGDFTFVIEQVVQEPGHKVLYVKYPDGVPALKKRLKGNTMISGFVFSDKKKLLERVFPLLRNP